MTGALVNTLIWGGMSFDDQRGTLSLEEDQARIHSKLRRGVNSHLLSVSVRACALYTRL